MLEIVGVNFSPPSMQDGVTLAGRNYLSFAFKYTGFQRLHQRVSLSQGATF
jgi:hypothetical protein